LMGSSIFFINSIINAFVGITCIVTANYHLMQTGKAFSDGIILW